MSTKKVSKSLSSVIEQSVAKYGCSPESVWLDQSNALVKGVKRCEAIFRMIEPQEPFSILDVGCGPGYAIDFLENKYGNLSQHYLGVDVSESLLNLAKMRWPDYEFLQCDMSTAHLESRIFDYTALNGVLTAKYDVSYEHMRDFSIELLTNAWSTTVKAMSFNVMSPYVDWERDDLFHWRIEDAMDFCMKELSRHINVLADYGLYEYTIQVFREPRNHGSIPIAWMRR